MNLSSINKIGVCDTKPTKFMKYIIPKTTSSNNIFYY